MRTKALLGLAALAASATIAMAQTSNVYSLNVVGYVNVTIPTGYSLIANPLNAGNNSVSNLFNVPVSSGAALGATVLTFSPGTGFASDVCDLFAGTWGNPALPLAPGTGFFFQNPNAPFTNTFVGTVNQGALSASYAANGYSLQGGLVPLTGFLQTDLGVTNANPGDSVLLYSAAKGFAADGYDLFGGGWLGFPAGSGYTSDGVKGPQIPIGTGFFYHNSQPTPVNVTLNFTVQ